MIKTLFGLLFKKVRNQINVAISHHDKKSFTTNSSNVHANFKLGVDNVISIDPTAKIDIAKNVTINQNNFITIKSNAKLKIGAETYITRATISCLGEIEIGENCILGEGMKLFDHNHQYSKDPFSVSKSDFNIGKIKIGNNVWTGANVTILKGVIIGDNVIVGAGCVIHKNVASNSIIVNKQEQKVMPL